MRTITRIILHCSASLEGVNLSGNDIRCMHCNPISMGGRGWRNPGYHYVVRLDGTIEMLLDPEYISNGVKGHNAESINICYIGGLRRMNNGQRPKVQPANTMTPQQRASIVRLLTDLHRRFPEATLHGHNEFAAKACPCFRVKEEFPEFADWSAKK